MTSNELGISGLTTPFTADSTTTVRYEVLDVETEIKLHHVFGFQASDHVAAYRPAANKGLTDADLEEDFRLFADESLELAKLAAPLSHETWPEY